MVKKLIPNLLEVIILCALAICAAIALACVGTAGNGIMLAAFPLVLGSMLMGARRAGHLKRDRI